MSITTAYISHGGGPLPLLERGTDEDGKGGANHKEMIEVLKTLSRDMRRPDVIVVVSAHWEENNTQVTAGNKPSLIYDYYGFPERAYTLQYPAFGIPDLSASIVAGLQAQGVDATANQNRGFDHGMFVPLTIMYPEADIPCIQVSLTSDLDAAKHIALGRALRHILQANCNDKHVLLLGSGSSFHNMRGFFDSSASANKKAQEFNQWLQETMKFEAMNELERSQKLIEWKSSPHGIFAHPREEHLLPLHVCYGANERTVDKAISLTLLTKPASMFVWKN
ncbi:DODA-type extradiol aromatic ring-opening family dioxygenase [Alteromonas lipotrueae]|uniref:DODA-type extradiol aromatic ring-opening family dioxygenase n=1 Tax=Alteromonas lipotrueae TaxID=2803814 RepID=UPI001C4929D7|nr:class III extradiol ring-cleavage dioxygenase [Alteromonas lipotrueae]